MSIELNLSAYEQALAQERLNLSFANITFDPNKHPRVHGKFTKVLNDLKPGQAANFPDGTQVRKRSTAPAGHFDIYDPAGGNMSRHESAHDAAHKALAYSGVSSNPRSFGGTKSYPSSDRAIKAHEASQLTPAEEKKQNALDKAQSARLKAAKGKPVGDMHQAFREMAINAQKDQAAASGKPTVNQDTLAKAWADADHYGTGEPKDYKDQITPAVVKAAQTGDKAKLAKALNEADDYTAYPGDPATGGHNDLAEGILRKLHGENVTIKRGGVRKLSVDAQLTDEVDEGKLALALSQARLAEGLNLATFDESKHPRLHGKFSKVFGTKLPGATSNANERHPRIGDEVSTQIGSGKGLLIGHQPGKEFGGRGVALVHHDGQVKRWNPAGIVTARSHGALPKTKQDEAKKHINDRLISLHGPDESPAEQKRRQRLLEGTTMTDSSAREATREPKDLNSQAMAAAGKTRLDLQDITPDHVSFALPGGDDEENDYHIERAKDATDWVPPTQASPNAFILTELPLDAYDDNTDQYEPELLTHHVLKASDTIGALKESLGILKDRTTSTG